MFRGSARTPALIELAERYVALELDQELFRRSPVDLFAVASARRIHTIELRPSLADGCLIVGRSGFKVVLNDDDARTFDSTVGETRRSLKVRSRFTLSHEIAHTLTYDLTCPRPRERAEIVKMIADVGGREAKSLEDFCQIAAGLILMPSNALLGELRHAGTIESLDAVLNIADKFRVSPEVVIHRLAQMDEDRFAGFKSPYYVLVMIKRVGGLDKIVASLYPPGLELISRPTYYSRVATWLKNNSRYLGCTEAEPYGTWDRDVRGRGLHIAKNQYERQNGSYFIQVKLAPE